MFLFFFTCIYPNIAHIWKIFKTSYPTNDCMFGSIIDTGITIVLFENFDILYIIYTILIHSAYNNYIMKKRQNMHHKHRIVLCNTYLYDSKPKADAVAIMTPPPLWLKCRTATLVPFIIPIAFTFIIFSSFSSRNNIE